MDYLKDVFSKVGVAGLDNVINRRQHWTRFQRIFYCSMFVFLVGCSVAFVTSSLLSYLQNSTAFTVGRKRDMKCPVEAYTVCRYPRISIPLIRQYIYNAYGNLTPSKILYYQQVLEGISNFSILGLDKFESHWFDPTLPGERYDILPKIFQYKMSPIRGLSADCYHHTSNISKCEPKKTIYNEAGTCYCYGCQYDNTSNHDPRKLVEFSAAKVYEPCLSSMSRGFCIAARRSDRVYIHAPFDIPNYIKPYFTFEIKEKCIEIGGEQIVFETYAERRMESLNPHQRKCQFPFESTLSVAPYYTQSMCLMQCRMELAIRECGCLPHIYNQFGSFKPCSARHFACVASLKDIYWSTFTGKSDCPCEKTCGDFQFIVSPHQQREAYSTDCNCIISIFTVPARLDDTTIVHDLIYSGVDLLASWGGAVSFFLDMSFLTVIELLFQLLTSPVVNVKYIKNYLLNTVRKWLTNARKIRICIGSNIVKRSLWIVVILSFTGLSIWISTLLVEGISVVMHEGEIRQTPIPFRLPSFSLCNRYTELYKYRFGRLNNRLYILLFPGLNPIDMAISKKYLEAVSEGLSEEHSWDDIYKVSKNCSAKMRERCAINGEEFKCCEGFHYLHAEVGPCFTLNSLQTGHSVTRGMAVQHLVQKMNATEHTKVTLRLTLYPDEFLNVTAMHFHSWADVPSIQMLFPTYNDYLDYKSNAVLKPRETHVDRDVVELPPEIRGCRMIWEPFPGSFYPSYSVSTCLAECRVLKLMKLCGCVHPMSPVNNKTPVCGLKEIACFAKHLYELSLPIEMEKSECVCPLGCADTHFNYLGTENYDKLNGTEIIYDHKVVAGNYRLRLRLMVGQVDKFVLVGGVFSLFLGASVMNLCEIVFFLTLRLLSNIRKGLRTKSAQEEA